MTTHKAKSTPLERALRRRGTATYRAAQRQWYGLLPRPGLLARATPRQWAKARHIYFSGRDPGQLGRTLKVCLMAVYMDCMDLPLSVSYGTAPDGSATWDETTDIRYP